MKLDLIHLRQYAPYLAPIIIVGVGWGVFIRPMASDGARVARDLEGLRQRIAAVRAQVGAPQPPPEPLGDPLQAFQRQVAAGDASGQLLEELSRLAGNTGVRVDTIETAEEVTAGFGAGPTVAGGTMPDPRLALFETRLKYSPVTLTAQTDYESLGEFLWRLRDLATVIEVRRLDIAVPAEPASDTAPARGTVRVTLTLFAYSRVQGSGVSDRGRAS